MEKQLLVKSENKPLLVIIDGSSMLSTAYYALLPAEIKRQKDDELKKMFYHKVMQARDGTFTNAVYGMSGTLIRILKDAKPDYIAVVFDKTRDTFRRKIYVEYKAQRKETPEPLKSQFGLMQQILNDMGIAMLVDEHYEADDLAGSLTEKFMEQTRIRLITKDRDYLQLVDDVDDVRCWVPADIEKTAEFFSRYSKAYGSAGISVPDSITNMMDFIEECVVGEKGVYPRNIPDLKGIEGDASDNIPGVRGVSSAAAPLIMQYGNLDQLIRAIEACQTEKEEKELITFWKDSLGIKRSPLRALKEQKEIAVMSKRLATICRDIDLDVELDDLSVSNVSAVAFNKWMTRLDIKTISM